LKYLNDFNDKFSCENEEETQNTLIFLTQDIQELVNELNLLCDDNLTSKEYLRISITEKSDK
jgi:hypothetical protein